MVALVIIGLFLGCGGGQSDGQVEQRARAWDASSNTPSRNTQVLFVVLAQEAAIRSDQGAQAHRLTLSRVNPEVLYFADRPKRFSGHLDLAKFLSEWDTGSYKSDPPNAALEAVWLNAAGRPGRSKSHAVELKAPIYDRAGNRLQLQMSALPGSSLPTRDLERAEHVALFIDDVCLSCW